MKARVTFPDSKPSEFPLIPKGNYNCKVFNIYDDESVKGNPMLRFEYKITDEGEFKGLKLFEVYSLLHQSLWRLQQLLMTFGVDEPTGKQNVDFEALIGKKCLVTVGHENYEGIPRARVLKIVGKEKVKIDEIIKTDDDFASEIEDIAEW